MARRLFGIFTLGAGESLVAKAGAMVAGTLLVAGGATVWWAQIPLNELSGTRLQVGLGAIAVASLIGLWSTYRWLRNRLLGLGLIGESLADFGDGHRDAQMLHVGVEAGPEVNAWNEVVRELAQLRNGMIADRATATLAERSGGNKPADTEDFDPAWDALPVGIILIDETGHARYANGAASTFLRRKRDEIVGKAGGNLIDQSTVIEALASVLAGNGTRRTEDVKLGENGAGGILRVRVRPLRKGEGRGALMMIEDVTQQRMAEENRKNFVSQATHELRTPLTNMRLCIETAIEDCQDNPAALPAHLNMLNSEARRLERIVGEMLSISEIEAGALRLREDDVKLDIVLNDIRTELEPQAAEKQITLTFAIHPKLPTLRADRDKIALAIHNLVGNAVKYTPDGGTVHVEVKPDAIGNITIDVTDSGIGIAEADLEKIFDRFYRADDPRVREITGTGLGLALVREIVHLHGGQMKMQSVINQGSTFSVLLKPAPAGTNGNAMAA